ncbi:NADH-ubiquinone oxidoreductase chain N [Dehalobacter sp. UNSWDHB]|jgi:proton-translocating NADH-quinone oxidoreductase, chain N|uniref:NADH-quinone oxidoreductase subunit N n=1 Tax=unclassified Dehalobacter TaxID=2635733 RepID=UPI00028B49A5|nr:MULTISPECIES: NADH-quinone oxidoreductase subunit N [unclassified Dehalobacter]AFV03308.1 NADH-ubiquinone oxidoreductase chain N [Dehalobacter sp. DCA]AFV06296.1 NADH-ubiquinone oxidoreductase chain N [Dehalobacter sp. CF]EQB20077.1 NADH-ubiquinone oxidoreductase chain N [Dehalobacter sp. UNSWDHB]
MNINVSLFTTEIATALLGLVVLAVGLFLTKEKRHRLGYVIAVGLAVIFVYSFGSYGQNTSVMDGMFIIDDFAVFFKQLFMVAAILVILTSTVYVKKMGGNYEFYVITLVAALGMMVLASAGDLLTLYVALETMTISFYILAGYKTDLKSSEAGIKYLVLGAVSSGILLYGLSLVYGMTGTFVIRDIAESIRQMDGLSPAILVGIIFLLSGLGFKVSLVPFHMWSPDVYEGAPTPVTTFLATGSKAASFAALARILIEALPGYSEQWTYILAIMAAMTMVIGNIAAIPQTNIKRMLAYSSIAQAGYIITGIIAMSSAGIKAVAFYSMVYVLATIGAFAVVITFSQNTGSEEIKDFGGLAQRSPFMAAVLTVCLLSMAGIPPLAGFVGKLYLFSSIVNQGYLWLVILGLVMSMVSVYYYLLVVKAMYMNDPVSSTPIKVPVGTNVTLLLILVLTLVLGVYAEPLSVLANMAGNAIFPF